MASFNTATGVSSSPGSPCSEWLLDTIGWVDQFKISVTAKNLQGIYWTGNKPVDDHVSPQRKLSNKRSELEAHLITSIRVIWPALFFSSLPSRHRGKTWESTNGEGSPEPHMLFPQCNASSLMENEQEFKGHVDYLHRKPKLQFPFWPKSSGTILWLCLAVPATNPASHMLTPAGS